MSFWRKGSDNLVDGSILGLAFSAALIWGTSISNWIAKTIPADWNWLDSINITAGNLMFTEIVIILGLGVIAGYITDRI